MTSSGTMRILLAVLSVVLAGATQTLFDGLASVQFANSGTTNKTDAFTWLPIKPTAGEVLYLESYNVSATTGVCGAGSWSTRGTYPYLYRINNTQSSTCVLQDEQPGYDRHGGDLTHALINVSQGENGTVACANQCCENPECLAFVYVASNPFDAEPCAAGMPCCWLKNTLIAASKSTDVGITTALVSRSSCGVQKTYPGMDMPGGDITQVVLQVGPSDNATMLCANECCNNKMCAAFTYTVAPSDFGQCKAGDDCCYLKSAPQSPVARSFPGLVSGVVTTTPPPAPANKPVTPPSGLRSAIPLGGISTGSVELRGDGRFHEWTIVNQSPGGSSKIQEYEHAYLALKAGGVTKALQTNPFDGAVPPVDAITYSGSYPVSRLQIHDESFAPLSASLFAFSAFKANSMAESARPAAAFTLALDNTAGSGTETVSYMLHLPLNVEPDQDRAGVAIGAPTTQETPAACATLCRGNPQCASWTWLKVNGTCTLQSNCPANRYKLGTYSGVPGTWVADEAGQCMTLVRPASAAEPTSGNVSLCLASEGVTAEAFDYGTSDDAGALFGELSTALPWEEKLNKLTTGTYGAVLLTADVAAGANATVTITMGWSFPNRDHFGQNVGNYYTETFPTSADAAWGNVPVASRTAALGATLADILEVHKVLQAGSMPDYMQDQLLNSLSHTRSAMWWKNCKQCHKTADARSPGFYRQWEAYDCDDLDSIHNDGERHLPYLFFFPNSSRNKLAAWAGNQQANGMLAEQILNTAPDTPQGRIMSDSTSMFIFYILELAQWADDTETLKMYYPTVKRAAEWQMNVSATYGVPLSLQTTYDIVGLNKYQLNSYSSVFHIAALQATEKLAVMAGDAAFAATAKAGVASAQAAFDKLQWNGRYYDAGSSGCTAGSGCSQPIGLFSDSFNAQVYAYALGLGPVVANVSRMASHQAYVGENLCKQVVNGSLVAGCPNGLITMTGRAPEKTDLQIWEMASYNQATLQLYLGGTVADSLSTYKASATSWSRRINDQWATAGLKDTAGYPTCTTHYGYHMISWHTPLALSGQQANMAEGNSSLFFTPRVPRPFVLPVLLPGVIGLLEADASTNVTLRISNIDSLKPITLSHVGVDHALKSFSTPQTLQPGSSITWPYPPAQQ